MSYFNYVIEKGYQGKKVFDKYGNLSKAFKKFIVEKKGKLNLPQDWLYIPEHRTHKFVYKPMASKRVLKNLEQRKTNLKYEKQQAKQTKQVKRSEIKAENFHKHGQYMAFKDIDDQVKKLVPNRNTSFTLTLKSSKGPFHFGPHPFTCMKHFEKWLEKTLSYEIAQEYGQWIITNGELVDMLAHCRVKVDLIAGGCNKHNKPERNFEFKRYKIHCHNPMSMNNNCGFKCIEYLLNKPIAGKDINDLRKEYNMKVGEMMTPEVMQKIYYKSGGSKHLIIVDESYELDIDLQKYNYVYFSNNHYYVIMHVEMKEMVERKATKRGHLYWDIETRETEEFVWVGETRSYKLKDTITAAYYKPYKKTEYKKIVFTTNENKSSVRQFLDWLIVESHEGRSYNCVAHNGARFDHYFLTGCFSKYEQLHAVMQFRGYSIIGIEFSNHQFKDSYCFMTFSLDKLCADYKIKDAKKKEFVVNGKVLNNTQLCFYKSGLKFDEFMALQKNEPQFWEIYVDYCVYDCISLSQIWDKFSNEVNSVIEKMGSFLLRNCSVASCNTIGSLAKKLVDNLNKKNSWYHDYLKFIDDDVEKYNFVSNFKRGGISHVNQPGKHVHSVVSFDICSQYPTSLVKMKIPIGTSDWVDKYDPSKVGYYKIENLTWNKTKTFKPIAGKQENGVLDWNNPSEIMYIDSFTIEYLRKYYGLMSFDVIQGLVSNKWTSGSNLFGKYVNTLFKEKALQDKHKDNKDDKYNPAYREVIKLFLNSLTGKLVEDPSKYFGLNYTVEEAKDIKTLNGIGIQKDRKEKLNAWLNAGVMVYSYSKRLLFEYVRCLPNDSDDVINVETDSMYFDKRHKDVFVENINKYVGEYPVEIGNQLGNVKQEYDTDESSYFLGKKMYCISKSKKIKGIPLRTIDDDGNNIELVTKELYEKLYNGETLTVEFKTLKKQIFGETYISCHNMKRTVRGRLEYKLYD